MQIRRSTIKDCYELSCLLKDTILYVNSKDYDEKIIKFWYNKVNEEKFSKTFDKCKRWVAVEDNKIIGFADHGLNGYFWGLYVHKDYIGKGVGSKLIKIVEKSIEDLGLNEIILKSSITAIGFYKKHGYEIIEKGYHPVGNEKMEIFIMKKII